MIAISEPGQPAFWNGQPIYPNPSQSIINHSPDGFAWGYAGSGPAQLAHALLLFFTTESFTAAHYQQFKDEVIARQPQNQQFCIDEHYLKEWAKARGWREFE